MSLDKAALEALADPVRYQVMPSVGKGRVKGDMPPPPPPSKTVLEEEEFVEKLEDIIEGTFFPDIQRLKAQKEWLEALRTKDPVVIATVRQKLLTAARRAPTDRSGGLVLETPTPLRGASTPLEGGGGATAARVAGTPPPQSLDAFLATNTSEDNASFQKLLDADHAKQRAKQWWAFDDDAAAKASALLLAHHPHHELLEDRSRAGVEDRATRPTLNDSWKHRTRNQLMFPPDLEGSYDTSRVPPSARARPQGAQLRLTSTAAAAAGVKAIDDGAGGTTLALPHGLSVNGDGGVVAPKIVNHRGTRFQGNFLESQAARALAEAVAPDAMPPPPLPPDGGAGSPTVGGYGYVATPSPMPGEDGDAPVMTWGDIEGTPLVLDPSQTPLELSAPSPFQIQRQDDREAAAHALDRKAKAKKKAAKQARARLTAGSTPGTVRASRMRTPLSLARMSPAARAVAARLGVRRGSITPLPGGGGSARRPTHRKRSQAAGAPVRKRAKQPVGDVTDGLLKLE